MFDQLSKNGASLTGQSSYGNLTGGVWGQRTCRPCLQCCGLRRPGYSRNQPSLHQSRVDTIQGAYAYIILRWPTFCIEIEQETYVYNEEFTRSARLLYRSCLRPHSLTETVLVSCSPAVKTPQHKVYFLRMLQPGVRPPSNLKAFSGEVFLTTHS